MERIEEKKQTCSSSNSLSLIIVCKKIVKALNVEHIMLIDAISGIITEAS